MDVLLHMYYVAFFETDVETESIIYIYIYIVNRINPVPVVLQIGVPTCEGSPSQPIHETADTQSFSSWAT